MSEMDRPLLENVEAAWYERTKGELDLSDETSPLVQGILGLSRHVRDVEPGPGVEAPSEGELARRLAAAIDLVIYGGEVDEGEQESLYRAAVRLPIGRAFAEGLAVSFSPYREGEGLTSPIRIGEPYEGVRVERVSAIGGVAATDTTYCSADVLVCAADADEAVARVVRALGDEAEVSIVSVVLPCGHQASGNGFDFRCDLPAGHDGLHQQTVPLREGSSRTNWGDDGLAPHATKGRQTPEGWKR